MNEVNYLALLGRVKDLEARVKKLENRQNLAIVGGDAQRLLELYPFMMNKSDAAKAIGVSRHTIYKMITDGVLEVNPVGGIPTRSVIDYITKGTQDDY